MIVMYEQKFAEDTVIEYSGITSCMSVTCVLPGQRFLGAHFTVMYAKHMEGILNQMNIAIGARPLQALYIAGAFMFWGNVPDYAQFSTAQAVQTYRARLGAVDTFMLDLAGGGERPRFEFNQGAVRVTNQAAGGADITDNFNEL